MHFCEISSARVKGIINLRNCDHDSLNITELESRTARGSLEAKLTSLFFPSMSFMSLEVKKNRMYFFLSFKEWVGTYDIAIFVVFLGDG